MHEITNTVLSEGYVNEHCLKRHENQNKATLVVYLNSEQCSNDDKRQEAISNLANKINELKGVNVVHNDFTGRFATKTGIRRQQRGILASIRLRLG